MTMFHHRRRLRGATSWVAETGVGLLPGPVDGTFAVTTLIPGGGIRRRLLRLQTGVCQGPRTSTVKETTNLGKIGPAGIGRSSRSSAIFVADWRP